jgi:hypothetical protein
MYPSLDVQTSLTFARLHQAEIHAAYPRGPRRIRTWWRRRRLDQPVTPPSTVVTAVPTPQRHRPAAA